MVQNRAYFKTSSTQKIIASQQGGLHNFKLHYSLFSKETDKFIQYDFNFWQVWQADKLRTLEVSFPTYEAPYN